MKLYLDDIRTAPSGWIRVYTAQECIDRLMVEDITELSLDHDLGDESIAGNGYQVLEWLEEQVFLHNFKPPDIITVHSSNTSAADKMRLAINSIHRFAIK